jgi:hypothetical protein
MKDSRIYGATAFFLTILLFALPFTPAAHATEEFVCEEDCIAAIRNWVQQDSQRFVPLLGMEAERFEAAAGATCSEQRDAKPVLHGIVIAPLYPGYVEYPSTQNDAQLLSDLLSERGVAEPYLHVLKGSDVTREKIVGTLTEALRCVRERDRVVLALSGDAGSYAGQVAPTYEGLATYMCADPVTDEDLAKVCENMEQLPDDAAYVIETTFRKAIEDNSGLVFFDSTIKIDSEKGRDGPEMLHAGIDGFDISNFITQVRNRGADALALIDASYAENFWLLRKQRDAVRDGGWYWNTSQSDQAAEQDADQQLVPLFGSGQFAAFYSAAEGQTAGFDAIGADNTQLGFLAFAFTQALSENSEMTISELAARMRQAMADAGSAETPVFEASSPQIRIFAATEETAQKPQTVEIIAPAPKRGASAIEEESFTLVARYTGTAKAARAIVDGEVVPVDANGQFRHDIKDAGSRLSIGIRVLSADFATLATTELKLRDQEDEPLISAGTRRIALVIANQTYGGSAAFPDLATPSADAEAVAKLLKERFGFSTEIVSGGTTLNLFLKDASKAQIQQVLFDLRQRLTAEDQLIVYYAGHGENDPDLGAFWVPVDGQPKADFTWIAAEEITRELKRMNAGSVLVISDSCYAGGLSRGGADAGPGEARERYLAKASRMKARQLMASGGEEPVEDGGGGGHSVFAKALIEALKSMPDRTFTASELFEQKVKPAVISAASATAEGQTPVFSRISRAGDEPGSEFIFQAVQ